MQCEVVKEHLNSGHAGILSTNQQGYLPGCGVVRYFPTAITNIFSLRNASRRYRVEYDSEKSNWFVLTMKSATKKVFELSESGLYYLDASAELARSKSAATGLVNTVEDNKTSNTNAGFVCAKQARKLQRASKHS